MPGCLMLDSLDDGAFCTESCPRLRATMATARNLLRVPRLGLLAFCLFSRSSALRLLMLCSEHTKETCMVPRCRAAGSLLPGAQPHAPPGAARRGGGRGRRGGLPPDAWLRRCGGAPALACPRLKANFESCVPPPPPAVPRPYAQAAPGRRTRVPRRVGARDGGTEGTALPRPPGIARDPPAAAEAAGARQQPKFRRPTPRGRALLLTSAEHHSANMTAAGLGGRHGLDRLRAINI